MKYADILDQIPGDVVATRVYGEPIHLEGATVIPVARVRGGGSAARRVADTPGCGGLGVTATPVGVFVICGGEVTWKAAIDENRIALIGVITGLASAVIATLAVLRRPPWPDLHIRRRPTAARPREVG